MNNLNLGASYENDREKLWEEYQKKKTPELREKLIIDIHRLSSLLPED